MPFQLKKVNKMQSIITALFLGLKYKRGTVWEGQTPLVTVVYSLRSCWESREWCCAEQWWGAGAVLCTAVVPIDCCLDSENLSLIANQSRAKPQLIYNRVTKLGYKRWIPNELMQSFASDFTFAQPLFVTTRGVYKERTDAREHQFTRVLIAWELKALLNIEYNFC